MRTLILAGLVGSLLSACAVVPTAPQVSALPGSRKTFDAFQRDEAVCRNYAYVAAGGSQQQQASNQAAFNSAALGTVIGAAAGALIDGGHGAAAGAGLGLLTGAAVGSSQAQAGNWSAQGRYDSAYLQCMYERGNKVPGAYVSARPAYSPARPPSYSAPPPPNARPPRSAPPPDAAIPPPDAPPPSVWTR